LHRPKEGTSTLSDALGPDPVGLEVTNAIDPSGEGGFLGADHGGRASADCGAQRTRRLYSGGPHEDAFPVQRASLLYVRPLGNFSRLRTPLSTQ